MTDEKRFDEWASLKKTIHCVLLSQAGNFSANRLLGKIDRIRPTEFKNICMSLQGLLLKNNL